MEQIQQLKKDKELLESDLEFSEKNWKDLNKVVKAKDKEIHEMGKELKVLSEVKTEFEQFKATVNRERKDLEKKRKKAEKKDFLDNMKTSSNENGNFKCNQCDVKKDSYNQLRNHERALHMQSTSTETEIKVTEDKQIQSDEIEIEMRDIETIESESEEYFEKYACYYCEQDIESQQQLKMHRRRCHGASKVPSLFSLPVRCPLKKNS